jgi:hypothetical protein
MEVYVANLRGLRTTGTQQPQPVQPQQQQQQQQQRQQQQLVADLHSAAAQQIPLQDLPRILRAGGAAVAAQQMLPELLRLLLDEVVCCMADHLPLLDIVGRIIQQHGTERFGEFRSTLLGLLGATGYDSAILSAANRLITGDAFTTVRHAYGLRQLARAIQEQQQQVEAAAAVASGVASSSSSSLMVAPTVPAAGAVPAAAVQSAMLLGVLGSPGSYDSSSSSGGRLSSRYSLTQADRDLIQGILGAGGMRLQLHPAGPVGHIPGVAAAYKAAAQAVADSGRMFHAEMDLALELAMLQSLQEHQQHQRQQHGAAGDSKGWGTGSWGVHEGEAADASQQEQQQCGSGGGGAARVTTTSSFDIDELLTWSHVNM